MLFRVGLLSASSTSESSFCTFDFSYLVVTALLLTSTYISGEILFNGLSSKFFWPPVYMLAKDGLHWNIFALEPDVLCIRVEMIIHFIETSGLSKIGLCHRCLLVHTKSTICEMNSAKRRPLNHWLKYAPRLLCNLKFELARPTWVYLLPFWVTDIKLPL